MKTLVKNVLVVTPNHSENQENHTIYFARSPESLFLPRQMKKEFVRSLIVKNRETILKHFLHQFCRFRVETLLHSHLAEMLGRSWFYYAVPMALRGFKVVLFFFVIASCLILLFGFENEKTCEDAELETNCTYSLEPKNAKNALTALSIVILILSSIGAAIWSLFYYFNEWLYVWDTVKNRKKCSGTHEKLSILFVGEHLVWSLIKNQFFQLLIFTLSYLVTKRELCISFEIIFVIPAIRSFTIFMRLVRNYNTITILGFALAFLFTFIYTVYIVDFTAPFISTFFGAIDRFGNTGTSSEFCDNTLDCFLVYIFAGFDSLSLPNVFLSFSEMGLLTLGIL